ncbi:MAG: caspase family protein, partial [Leptolyngbyaceae cyanobacterium MO_188.B28]|nr:caspase family protein [Leptolyngbyaceae cyanobacterium MO_188.B28]
YISQRLENLGFPCQVIVAHDRNHALREVESQAPHLVIASEQLRQYETIRDIEGLLFLEKIDQLCPASLKVLILDRQPDDDQELRNLIDRFFISRTFLRANAALDMLGFVDAVIQLLTTKDFFKDGYALLVGVGEDLPVTVKDAQALYEVLSNPSLAAYPRNNIQLLTEQNANRANILDALDKLALKAQSNPEATISIYFSGHGVYLQETGDYFLVPYGCNRNNYATASISSREFTDKIRAIQTQKLILLLDCCHAGGMLEKTLGEPFIKSPPTPKLISDLSFGNGRVVVASSSREQFSYTGEPYSIFTACLLDALKGRPNKDNSDKYVRIFDVLLYLLEEVPKRALPSSQNPILPIIEEPSDNFPICFRPQLMVPNDVVKDLSWERRNLGSEISSKHIEERIEERIALFDTLSRLPNHQFEQLVFSLSVPQGNQGGAAATQGARISQLLEWADSAVGCGLAQLTQVLRQVMGSQD